MAWRSSSVNNEGLIANLRKNGFLKNSRNFEAFMSVDRGNYVIHPELSPYADTPLTIGKGQTISAPHMHAWCVDLLEEYTYPGARVLDVGSGSGYLTAVFGNLVGNDGLVIGIERIQKLLEFSIRNVEKKDSHLLKKNGGPIIFVHGNAWDGLKKVTTLSEEDQHVQFDCIHVGAAAEKCPDELLKLIKPGGRMVIPVGSGYQNLMIYDKDATTEEINQQIITGVVYVSLVPPSKDDESYI